jgi:hypothetical protein
MSRPSRQAFVTHYTPSLHIHGYKHGSQAGELDRVIIAVIADTETFVDLMQNHQSVPQVVQRDLLVPLEAREAVEQYACSHHGHAVRRRLPGRKFPQLLDRSIRLQQRKLQLPVRSVIWQNWHPRNNELAVHGSHSNYGMPNSGQRMRGLQNFELPKGRIDKA